MNYLQKSGPWLKQQYGQYCGPMDIQQFAYWNMITANGTNIAAAMQAQQDQFRDNQGAYASVQQGNDAYRKGMYANGETASEAVEGYSIGAIRGDSTQIHPSTRQEKLLPYAQPYNQPFDIGGERYVQNERGFYGTPSCALGRGAENPTTRRCGRDKWASKWCCGTEAALLHGGRPACR